LEGDEHHDLGEDQLVPQFCPSAQDLPIGRHVLQLTLTWQCIRHLICRVHHLRIGQLKVLVCLGFSHKRSQDLA